MTKTPRVNNAEKPKLLVSIPATKTSHLKFRSQVLAAIEKACVGYNYDLFVPEADEKGWHQAVANMNLMVDKFIQGNYTYLWMVEAEVIVPEHALKHLLSLDVDCALATVKWHNYPDNPDMQQLYKDNVCVAWFTFPDDRREAESLRCNGLKMQDAQDRILTFKDGPLEGGTGCILFKRSVFEGGYRFICRFEYASFDVYLWRDMRRAGLSAAVDGFVICDHLDDCVYQDEQGNPIFENIMVTKV